MGFFAVYGRSSAHPTGPQRRVRSTFIGAVLALAWLTGCSGPRESDAADDTAEIIDRIKAGDCIDTPSENLGEFDWRTACVLIGAELPEDADITVQPTVASPTGEIGFEYQNVANFIGADGGTVSVLFCYLGTGYAGTKPSLIEIELLDDEPDPAESWLCSR